MLQFPGASPEAGQSQRSACSPVSRIWMSMVVAAVAACSVPASGQQVQDILKKSYGLYAGATSYDGTITIHQSGTARNGKAGTVVTVHHVRFKAPNKFALQMKVASSGGGAPAKTMEQSVYSDGTFLYQYAPSQKKYTKTPAPPQVPFLRLLSQLGVGIPAPGTPGAMTSLAPATTVHGKSAYVIQVKLDTSKIPATVSPQIKQAYAAPFFFTIDKQSYYLLRVNRKAPFLVDVTVESQTINGNVADSAFHFTPPATATLMPTPPPTQPGMGGQAPGRQ